MSEKATQTEGIVDVTYPPIIVATKIGFAGLRLKLEITGAENIPTEGAAVLAGNHTGFLDFTFIGAAAEQRGRLVRFLCKREVFDNPIAGPIMRSMHHVSVDRQAGSQSFAQSLRLLKAGELVGIFPEGTISRSFEPIDFRPGATALAAAAKVPLLPVAMWGSQRVWTKARTKGLSLRTIPILVHVGEPMFFERREDHTKATEQVRQRITSMLHDLQSRYPDAPRDLDDAWWLPARLGGTAPTPAEALEIEHERRRLKEAKLKG
jgi:1-acyl-sn-glycerol-3-phosphate acyltransferase